MAESQAKRREASASPSEPAVDPVHPQNALRSSIKALLGLERIKASHAIDLSYTAIDTLVIYGVLTATIGLACFLHGSYGPIALLGAPGLSILSGIAFNWTNVQIHEASHYLLLPGKRANDRYCNLVLGSIALQDVETYRATHRFHHAYLHTEADPDLWVYSSRVGSVPEVLRGIRDDLLLVTIARRKRQVADFLRSQKLERPVSPRYVMPVKLLAQVIVVAAFISACGVWGLVYYLVVYLYGLLGVFPVLVRVRTVVQHYDRVLSHTDALSPAPFVSRTTVAPLLEFIAIGARMDYHFEHHLFPNIPYYRLAEMHRTLRTAGFFDTISAIDNPNFHTTDYVGTYATLSRCDK